MPKQSDEVEYGALTNATTGDYTLGVRGSASRRLLFGLLAGVSMITASLVSDFTSAADDRIDIVNTLVIDTNDLMTQAEKETTIAGRISNGGKMQLRPNQTITVGRNFYLAAKSLDLDLNKSKLIWDLSKTVTAMDAVADTLTVPSHGIAAPTTSSNATRIVINSTGTYPGGLQPNRKYWVGVVDANNIKLATTAANAFAGTFIDLTGSMSGTVKIATPIPEAFRIESSSLNTDAERFERVASIASIDDTVVFNSTGALANMSKLTFTTAGEADNWEAGQDIKIGSQSLESWGEGTWYNSGYFTVERVDRVNNCIFVPRLDKDYSTATQIARWKKITCKIYNGTIEYVDWQVLADDSDTCVLRTSSLYEVQFDVNVINAPSSVTLHYSPRFVNSNGGIFIRPTDKELIPFEPNRVKYATWDYATDAETVYIPNHNLNTADAVYFTTSGTYPTHADAGGGYGTQMQYYRVYYVIRVDDDNIKIARSSSLANAGTAFTFTSDGTGDIFVDRFPTSQFGYHDSQVGGFEGIHCNFLVVSGRHATDNRQFSGHQLQYGGPSVGKLYVGVKAQGFRSGIFSTHSPSHCTMLVGLVGMNSAASGLNIRGTAGVVGCGLYNVQRAAQIFKGNGGQQPHALVVGNFYEKCGTFQANDNAVSLVSGNMVLGSQRSTGDSMIVEGKNTSRTVYEGALWKPSAEGGNVVLVSDDATVSLRGVQLHPMDWTAGGPSLFQLVTASGEFPVFHSYGVQMHGTGWGAINGTSGVNGFGAYGTVFYEPGQTISSGERSKVPDMKFRPMIDGYASPTAPEPLVVTGTSQTLRRSDIDVEIRRSTNAAGTVTLPAPLPFGDDILIYETKGDGATYNTTVQTTGIRKVPYSGKTGSFPAGCRVKASLSKGTGIVIADDGSYLYLTEIKPTGFSNNDVLTATSSNGATIGTATATDADSLQSVNIEDASTKVLNTNYFKAKFRFSYTAMKWVDVA